MSAIIPLILLFIAGWEWKPAAGPVVVYEVQISIASYEWHTACYETAPASLLNPRIEVAQVGEMTLYRVRNGEELLFITHVRPSAYRVRTRALSADLSVGKWSEPSDWVPLK